MIIAVANAKGGTGKTTTAFNVAAGLAKKRKNVLLVSLDEQENLNDYVGYEHNSKETDISDLIRCITAGKDFDPADAIFEIPQEHIYYIPSSSMLKSAVYDIAATNSTDGVLKQLFAKPAFDAFDYIIIDCKPSLDILVKDALNAADKLIIPVQAEKFALDGVTATTQMYEAIRKTTNPGLDILGILITMKTHTSVADAVTNAARELYGDLVFKSEISRLVEAVNSTLDGKSLVNSNGRLAQQYDALVDEIIERS